MAKIRSPFDEDRRIPWLGDRVVEPDEVVEIPDEWLPNFLAGGWKQVDSEDITPPTKTTTPKKSAPKASNTEEA